MVARGSERPHPGVGAQWGGGPPKSSMYQHLAHLTEWHPAGDYEANGLTENITPVYADYFLRDLVDFGFRGFFRVDLASP
jgi:hypothetical protein